MDEETITPFSDYLLNHIRHFQNRTVKSLLNQNLVNAKDNYGSLLHYATKYDNHEIIQHLIELGSDVDSIGRDGRTPLMIAVLHNLLMCIEILLNAGASLDITATDGRTAVCMVFQRQFFKVEKIHFYFLDKLQTEITNIEDLAIKLAKASCTLHHIIHLNDYDLMTFMLKHGVYIDSRNSVGKTILHIAVSLQDIRMAVWLLENGAYVNSKDHKGISPILIAAAGENKILLQLLLDNGANLNIKDYERQTTPLFEAILVNKKTMHVTECINLLLENGAIPRNPNNVVVTIFDLAFMGKSPTKAMYLIAQLALLKKKGISIEKSVIRCKEREYQAQLSLLAGYYEKCEQVLEINMFEKLSLFVLLNDSKSKMISYARNDKFIPMIKEACTQREFGNLYPYYYNILTKRVTEAGNRVKLENISISILYRLFNSNENECFYIAARKIVGYLENHELEQLIEI